LVKEKDIDRLKQLGVKDSKHLTKNKREQLFAKLKAIAVDYELVIIQPKEIDTAVNSVSNNLNWLEAVKTAMILNKLQPDKAIVDSPSHNTQAYKDFLLHYILNKSLELNVENKAEQYLPVAAASVIAKVTRDNEIEKLKKVVGNFGSGYPSDPKTRQFAKENWFRFPKIFRKSWSTYKALSNQGLISQKKLNNF